VYGSVVSLDAPDERFAMAAVQRATGAALTRHDRDGLQAAVDYLLQYSDGRVGALEVTSVSDNKERALDAILAKLDHQLPRYGQYRWSIRVSGRTDVRLLRSEYRNLIAYCEALSIQDARDLDEDLLPTRWQKLLQSGMRMRRLGYEPFKTVEGAPHLLLPMTRGGFVSDSLSLLPKKLELVLSTKHVASRIAKLCNRSDDELHLFVWFGPGGIDFQSEYALLHPHHLPVADPPHMNKVTHLWLTTPYSEALLGWTSSAGWRWHDVYGAPESPTGS
jgi:hypothetical protein